MSTLKSYYDCLIKLCFLFLELWEENYSVNIMMYDFIIII